MTPVVLVVLLSIRCGRSSYVGAADDALNLLQKEAEKRGPYHVATSHSPERSKDLVPGIPGATSLFSLFEEIQRKPTRFFLYEPAHYEPRFLDSDFSKCERKGADYMFVESLIQHEHRVEKPEEADVLVVPCLFESYRRCTTTNHAEQPPTLLGLKANPHPEDFEAVPWEKPFDYDTEQCLTKVMTTNTFRKRGGSDHVWVVADWAINFGRTAESQLFKNMTIGRIEVVDEKVAAYSNRSTIVDQSSCSFVVPYASDLAYIEPWSSPPTFQEWMKRTRAVTYRFEDRQYVLFCGGDPCPGAPDATPLRRKSLSLVDKLASATVATTRVPMARFQQETHDAKFCLVMRGDTPSTHAFFDALAANCVPILISDEWEAVASPFAFGKRGHLEGGFEHSHYTLQFSERQWMEDFDIVIHQLKQLLADKGKLEYIFNKMQEHRKALLWSMPDNRVSDLSLQSARHCVQNVR